MRRTDRSDTELVIAARSDDGEAFGELFDRWFNSSWNVARTIVRQDDMAADVAQDALLSAWQRLDQLDNPDAFGGWLLRITRNRALNRLEREQRSRATGDEVVNSLRDKGLPDPTGADRPLAPDSISEVRDRQELVWAAAAALGEREVSLLDLHLRHGLSPAEIADELGVEANNAHQQLYRLRNRLGDAIGSYLLWRNGRPLCDGLAAAVSGDVAFDRSVARAVTRHQSSCDHCSERRASLVDPGKLFAGVPLVLVPGELKIQAAAALHSAGVPMGSEAATGADVGGSQTTGQDSAGQDSAGQAGSEPQTMGQQAGDGQAGGQQAGGEPGGGGQAGVHGGSDAGAGQAGGPGHSILGEAPAPANPGGGAAGGAGGSGATGGSGGQPVGAVAAPSGPAAGIVEQAGALLSIKALGVLATAAVVAIIAFLLAPLVMSDGGDGDSVAAIGSETDEEALAGPSAESSGDATGNAIGQLGPGETNSGDQQAQGSNTQGEQSDQSTDPGSNGQSTTEQPPTTSGSNTTDSPATASTTIPATTSTSTVRTTSTIVTTTTGRPRTTTTQRPTTTVLSTTTTEPSTTTSRQTTTTTPSTTTTPLPVVIVRFSSRRPSGPLLCSDPNQAPFEAVWSTENTDSVTLTMPNGTHRGVPSGSYKFCASSGDTIRLLAVVLAVRTRRAPRSKRPRAEISPKPGILVAMSLSTVAPSAANRLQPLAIGPLVVDIPVVLAPMAGVTNAPFRRLCRKFGAGLYVSEMISARALCEGSEKTDKLASFAPDETPRSLQLAGVDPHYMGQAVGRLVDEGRVDHIDLNFGCPVRKVTRHGGGGALPFKRNLYRAVVTAAVEAAGRVPVTVKFRVGVDDEHLTYLDAGRIAEDCGVAAVALHGRTVSQLYSGQADWSTIARLKEAVTTIPVLGNGDIWEAGDALDMMDQTGCDGVVIGRGCLGRPWLFGQLAAAFAGLAVPPPPTTTEVIPTMVEHAELLVEWFGHHKGIREFRKHTAWYLKGYPVGGELRGALGRIESLDHLAELLATVPEAPLPDENRRVARGHTRGPQIVALPDKWLDDPYDNAVADAAGDSAASGG